MAEATLETDAQPLQPRPTPRDDTITETRKPLHVPPIPNDFHFNKLLLEIGKWITDDLLRKIKFQYGGELKARTCKEIQSPEDLFTILRRRRYISPENVFHLQAIVMMIDDADVEKDLMERIYEYSRKHKAVFYRPSTDEPPNGYRRLKFHVEGLEHYQQFDTEAANILKIAVAGLTGINIGDVLLDGIQLTNSIYVTLLIPDRHYILFSSLLKNGIPLLTELKIDMVTFEDGTTIKASNGSQIVEQLPPVRESPDETIQRLKEALDELENENIAYRKRIEDLTLPDGFEEASDDLNAISRQLEESMNEAIEKHANRQLLQRIVSLNTRLVKGLESEKMRTKQKQLELELLERKHAGMLETRELEDVEENTGVGSNDATGNREKEKTVSDDKEPTGVETTHTTDEGNDETSQRLLDNLNSSKERAYALGYPKQVIREIILSCDSHVRHFMKKVSQQQLNSLTEECHLLRAVIANKDAILQLVLPSIDFKHDLMQQLETIFESKGETIPNGKGYKESVIKLAIDLSREISHEDGKTLETGYQDVKITTTVKRDRSFLLLRLLYLENLTSDAIILIEDFVSKKLAIIDRADLVKIWKDAVMPKLPSQENLLKQMDRKRILTPVLDELLQKFNAMITQTEKNTLRTNFPSTHGCTDDELLHRIVCDNFHKFTGQSEKFIEFMRELFTSIKRDALLAEFRREYYQLRDGLLPKVQEILRETSSKLSKTKKKRLRQNLIDQSRCIEENDVFERLVLEEYKGFMIPIGQLDGYVKSKLKDLDKQDLYEEFAEKMKEMVFGLQQQNVFMQFTQLPLHENDGSNRVIMQMLKELQEKVDRLQTGHTGFEPNLDMMNRVRVPPDNAWMDERYLRSFFGNIGNQRYMDINQGLKSNLGFEKRPDAQPLASDIP